MIFAPAKGMGLFNINKRLQLQYGTQLSIRSRPAHGTVVAFSFPAQRYEPPQPDWLARAKAAGVIPCAF